MRTHCGATASFLFTIASVLLFAAQSGAQPVSLKDADFLVGEWVGEGQGTPGSGAGWFSFTRDLQNSVVVRKSHTDYPAQNGTPAFAHDDLMIVFPEGTALKAFYVDNEGHTIRYSVSGTRDSVVFMSDIDTRAPRFRLTYTVPSADRLRIEFAIAPPGSPEAFRTYVEGFAGKKK